MPESEPESKRAMRCGNQPADLHSNPQGNLSWLGSKAAGLLLDSKIAGTKPECI